MLLGSFQCAQDIIGRVQERRLLLNTPGKTACVLCI